MKVAFTTSDGTTIDMHFGQCGVFHVWEVTPDDSTFSGTVTVAEGDDDEEDRIARRAEALSGCSIVYTMAIGGPAAAKLVARRIHPLKTLREMPVDEAIGRIQEVLRNNPPPWLKKAMGG